MYRREFFIGGQWVAPLGSEIQPVISPSTEEVVGEVPVAIPADMDAAVAAAKAAFEDGPWAGMGPAERADILARAAELIRKRESDIARVCIDEMGVAASSATAAQTGLVATVFDYYAELIRTYDFERSVVTGDRASLVTSVPIGVVAAIVPWNAPVTLAAWKVGPALAAGLHGRPQAAARGAAEQLPARRGARGGRRAGRRHQPGPRRPRGRRAPGPAHRRREGRLHRLDRRRQADHESLRPAGEAGLAGTGRQVGGDHPRRCRPRRRSCRASSQAACTCPGRSAALHSPGAGAPVPVRRSRRAGRLARREGHASATRTTRRPWSARWSPSGSATGSRVTSSSAVAEGAPDRRRRRAAGRPAQGLVRRADDPGRRRQLDADRPGGDLRSGAGLHSLRGRRRRRADRQRLAPTGCPGECGAPTRRAR